MYLRRPTLKSPPPPVVVVVKHEDEGDPPTNILSLPNEIFLMIAESISDPTSDPASVNNLILTNRRLSYLLTPWLHKLAILDKEDGTPALHWAALHGYIPLAQLLLKKLDISAISRQDSTGQTALHVALEHWEETGTFTIIIALVQHGINLDSQNSAGETALQLAVSKGHEQIVKLLLERKADVTIRDTKGQTVLHVATRNWGNGGSTSIAALLLDAGVDIDARNNLGETALHKAVLFAHTAMVRLLLERGASTRISDNWWGGTPLHWAADMGKHDIGKLLLASGAEISARDIFKGGTPFHWAAKRPTEAMLRLLLGKGADVDVVDNSGKKAVDWTVKQERRRGPREERVIAELLRRGVTSVPEYEGERDGWNAYAGSGQTNAYTLAALYCLHYQNVRPSG